VDIEELRGSLGSINELGEEQPVQYRMRITSLWECDGSTASGTMAYLFLADTARILFLELLYACKLIRTGKGPPPPPETQPNRSNDSGALKRLERQGQMDDV
jgi:hypothetical protein